MNIISARFFLLPQFFLLFFIHNSLSTLVKRQSIPSENDENGAAGDESPVGFGATDPPPSSLNEPIAVIGLDQTEDGGSGGKTVADVAYDASEDQPSSTPASSTAVPPAETPPSVQPATDDDSRLEALTTAAEASITTAAEEASPAAAEERNASRETVTVTEQSSTVTTTPSSARRTAVVPKKKESAAKERKGHKTGQPPPTAPVDKASEGAATVAPQRNCNSELMRRLIIENMHSKPSVAKRQIQSKVAEEINGKIDVVCAKHAFSYIVNSELFCEAEQNGVICLCFKQQ